MTSKKLYFVGSKIDFYIPSMSVEVIIEEGIIISDNTVRSLVDGEVHDILPEDIVNFKQKWKDIIWKSRQPSA